MSKENEMKTECSLVGTEDSLRTEKGIVDLEGSTKKVLDNMNDWFEKARHAADTSMIKPEKYWATTITNVKMEARITDELMLKVGFPVPLVVETLDLDEANPETLAYKNLILKKKDGSSQTIPVDDALKKIEPFTKNFKTPIEALVMGDPAAILKVMQHIYGQDIIQWSVPAEKESYAPALSALCLVELYRVAKFDQKSELYEKKDNKIVVKEGAAKLLADAFGKDSKEYLLKMFPHVLPDYVLVLLGESKTVLNELPKEVVDKLFPNINPEYLVNLKESELKELAKRMTEVLDWDTRDKAGREEIPEPRPTDAFEPHEFEEPDEVDDERRGRSEGPEKRTRYPRLAQAVIEFLKEVDAPDIGEEDDKEAIGRLRIAAKAIIFDGDEEEYVSTISLEGEEAEG